MTFGLIQLILILYFLIKIKISKNSDLKLLTILTISNFCLFLYIPAEKSYLQPAIIFLNLILIDKFNKNIVSLIIVLNFVSWFISYDFLKIQHKDNSVCAPKHAINASFQFTFSQGALYDFYDSRKNIACWVNANTIRGKRILEGKSTRVIKKNVK